MIIYIGIYYVRGGLMAEEKDFIMVSKDFLGEALRAFVFIGEGLGCYSNFEIRENVVSLSDEKMQALLALTTPSGWIESEWIKNIERNASRLKGYSFIIDDGIEVSVLWMWDGDGTLLFQLCKNDKIIFTIINDDCKKSYGWRGIP